MIDIAVNNLNKYYGSNHILKGITFEVYSGEKIGLLGTNGSGKTTLFKTIMDQEPYESGSIMKASGKKIDLLAQIPVFGENETVRDILCSSFQEASAVHEAMKKIEGDPNPAVLARYGRLMAEYERLGGYDIEVKIEKICNGMHIGEDMRDSRFSLLSGGEKTRVNLARILLRDCDILLLDEPTNHLDLASLAWLEKFLRDFRGTVVAISHDRAFLDNVVTRIIEVESGTAHFYEGNYSYYVEEKQQRFLTQAGQYKQQQKKIRQLETAAKRLHIWAKQADSAALHKRAFAIEKRIDQMDKVDKPATSKKLAEEFVSGGYQAKEVMAFDSVEKRYGPKVLLDKVNLSILRNDSIALIGGNGCGKSTLLRLITKAEAPDGGTLKITGNAKIAYMPQIITFENENATVLETLSYPFSLPEEKARSILAGFRFRAPDVTKKVCQLSGGEKSRLKLCILMQNKVNFLILDEPTNHLDIASREWIEDAVADFEGTMLFVSHDRYFLSKFASRIWHMHDGMITDFHCGFDEYLAQTAVGANESSAASSSKKKKPSPIKKADQPPKTPSVEALIGEAERALREVNAALESDLAGSDYVKVNALYEEKLGLEEKIEGLYGQWIDGK